MDKPRPQMLRLANLQYSAADSEAASMKIITPLLGEAATRGAELIALPECATIILSDRKRMMREAQTENQSRALGDLRNLAASHGIHLLIGSLLLKAGNDSERLVNRSFLITPDGAIAARYDKIHMFDATPGDGTRYRESDDYIPGNKAVLAQTAIAAIGMTICYDLRFPGLYRNLALAGAEIITIPAAFTRPTGAAHWEILLRARAIENGCFIMAPAQTGTHDGGRKTWGHALIVNPWGEVLADAGEEAGVISMAEIDLGEIESARQRIPAILNGRDFTPA